MTDKDKTQDSNVNKKTDLGLLEEDDDFEEFPAEGESANRLSIRAPRPKLLSKP